MADQEANNQGATDSTGSTVAEVLNAFSVPSQPAEQSTTEPEAGAESSQTQTPPAEAENWGKFKSKEEALKAYEELEKAHTKASQELASFKKQPESQSVQAPTPEPERKFIDFQLGQQPGQSDVGLYPGTEQMLGKTVDTRIGQFANQISTQLNPVLSQMAKKIEQLESKLVVADSRAVAANVADEFPEIKSDANFKAEVETTMKEMQQNLQINLRDAKQFDSLLRTACNAVRGKRGYVKGQAIKEEAKAAGQIGMKSMATGKGSEHGVEKSEADAIRDGIMQVASGPRSNSIF